MHLSLCLILTEHLLNHFVFIYVLSMIDLFIVAFNSVIVGFGNNILNTQNGIRFPSIPVSILYAILTLFWPVYNSSLLNITDFMLWNVKGFILTESKLLLLSSQFGTVTSSSLCISCMHLGCWDDGHIHAYSVEPCVLDILLIKHLGAGS